MRYAQQHFLLKDTVFSKETSFFSSAIVTLNYKLVLGILTGMKNTKRLNTLLVISFLVATAVVFWGGLKGRETLEIINLVITLSATMAGFGLVAFQIAHGSNELRHDFIEMSILMILSTVASFFYLIYPDKMLLNFNFGELSIFSFFWAFILLLIILIDHRLGILK